MNSFFQKTGVSMCFFVGKKVLVELKVVDPVEKNTGIPNLRMMNMYFPLQCQFTVIH